MQFILNPFLKVRVNDEQKYIMLLCKFHSYNCDFSSWMLLIRFNFQNNDKQQNSGEPYYSPQVIRPIVMTLFPETETGATL